MDDHLKNTLPMGFLIWENVVAFKKIQAELLSHDLTKFGILKTFLELILHYGAMFQVIGTKRTFQFLLKLVRVNLNYILYL